MEQVVNLSRLRAQQEHLSPAPSMSLAASVKLAQHISNSSEVSNSTSATLARSLANTGVGFIRNETRSDQASSSPSSSTTSAAYNNLSHYVNLLKANQCIDIELVRKVAAQHWPECLFIVVIIIYLIFYFSKVSRRPKLIGDRNSGFVKFIERHLKRTLERRFSPLIYFWGTNPQTALFGHLQGRTSLDEPSRIEKFKRQYLYVSDAQYLTSNIDLSKHYVEAAAQAKQTQTNKQTIKTMLQLGCNQLEQETTSDLADTCLAGGCHQASSSSGCDSSSRSSVISGLTGNSGGGSCTNNSSHSGNNSLLNHNIRVALENMMNNNSPCASKPRQLANGSPKLASSANSSSGSTDSGVYPTNASMSASDLSGSASSSSSTSSLSDSDHNRAEKQHAKRDRSNRLAQAKQDKHCDCNNYANLSVEQQSFIGQHQQHRHHHHHHHHDHTNQLMDQMKKPSPALRSEQLDFGQCALDWSIGSHQNYHQNKLVALISAGMTTGSDKRYVTDTVETLESLGFECCVFIRRGVGGLKLSSAKFFSPAKWRDFEAAVLSVRQQRPNARLLGIGFSFGSIELCRYLAMSRKRSLVDAALLISCPFDPEAGGSNMRRHLLNRKIDAYLARNLGKQLHLALPEDVCSRFQQQDDDNNKLANYEHKQSHEQANENKSSESHRVAGGAATAAKRPKSISSKRKQQNIEPKIWMSETGSCVDLARLPKIKSLVDFEDKYNRLLQHYPNREAYAADSRLQEHLAHIETPTLCLSSEDDFMAPLRLLPLDEIRANKNLCMVLTKRGGHMGFIDGLLWPKKPYFAQRVIRDYVAALKGSILAGATIDSEVGTAKDQATCKAGNILTAQQRLMQMF